MPKKSVKKKAGSKKKAEPKTISKKIELDLAKNIVKLQKVHTELVEKIGKLSDQMTILLNLFEATAKTFATHPEIKASEKDREFLDKIDKLLDQNKTIAKGLTLVEERTRERIRSETPYMPREQFRPPAGSGRPIPKF